MKPYTPSPIDTATVALTPELLALTERLAENAHALWAAQRFAQGWTLGSQRDDAKKLHPCLVPYADLPEKEKEFDRTTALRTLKAILQLGNLMMSPKKWFNL
jgi:ryanodine receptor 2